MSSIQKKILSWAFCFGTIILLIAFVRMQFQNNEDASIKEPAERMLFYYDDNYATALHETDDGNYCVYLPSFADISDIQVRLEDETVKKATFISDFDTFSVYDKKKNKCSFQTEEEYEILFFDEEDKVIEEATVVFMASANLPTLYLSTESGTFEAIDEDKAYSEGAIFSFVTADGDSVFRNMPAEVSARGNHTFNFEKKSYQFDLGIECDLLNMGKSETWILLCNSYDLSNLRNKITYDMAERIGMEGSPKAEFVDVYFNNIYHGTYLLSEKVEFGKNRIDYAGLEDRNKLVNEKKLREYEAFDSNEGEKKGFLLPNNPNDITGGYLIEHDYKKKYDEEVCGFRTQDGELYVINNPKHASVAEVDYISNLFQEIEDAIKSEDGYNKKTGKHYSEYIDMKSWADKYIVEEFSKNHGGGCTSSYFYKLPDEVSTKVYGGPVWDYDKAYGRNVGLSGTTNDLNFLTLHTSYTNLFYYLYQHDDFREVVFEEYRNVFSPYIADVMLPELDYYEELLEPSLQLNFHRFADMFANHIELDTSLYRGDVEYLRQFIIERKATLDAMWGEGQEICNVKFVGLQESNRSAAVLKGDQLRVVPKHWEDEEMNYIWVDSETGEPLVEGMIVEKDINAVLELKEE